MPTKTNLVNTQALVLHTTQYSETSVIAKVFTRELGLKSYILKGARAGGGKNLRKTARANLLQPLSHLDMTVYDNPKKELQYVKEFNRYSYGTAENRYTGAVPSSLGTSPQLLSLHFFVDELLYRTIRPDEPDSQLFDFTANELSKLQNASPSLLAHFPITYMLELSKHLGIQPIDNYSIHEPLFNIKEGRFLGPAYRQAGPASQYMQSADYFISSQSSLLLHHYINGEIPIDTLEERTTLLGNLIDYFSLHVASFHSLNSVKILHEVLKN